MKRPKKTGVLLRRLHLEFAWTLAIAILWSTAAGAEVTTTRIASGLSSPTCVVSPLDDVNRLFVIELGGNIRIHDLTTEIFDATPFLTVSGTTGEGLQGLAFHPNYAVNGFLYVYYLTASPLRSVVERYTRDATNPDLADPASVLTIIEIPQRSRP